MRRSYIVGNWKMNGLRATLAEVAGVSAVAASGEVEVAICPPATLIAPMAALTPGFAVGAQDCHPAASGPFTGSLSAAMLVEAGASVIIVGHSERREGCGETDADVRAKAEAALAAGANVILCVGEPLSVREAGGAIGFVVAQVAASLPVAPAADRLAIAYEPIWAIGTGRTPTTGDVAAMHAAIRGALAAHPTLDADATRIIYGGSVTADNAATLLALADVDGALVGGASLTAAKFAPIIAAAARG